MTLLSRVHRASGCRLNDETPHRPGRPRALFAGAWLLSALGLAAVAGDGGPPCSDLYQLATAEIYDKHVWTALEQFRQMEPTCAGTENEPLYHSFRAQLESYVVNHQAALRYFDARTSSRPQEPATLPREVARAPPCLTSSNTPTTIKSSSSSNGTMPQVTDSCRLPCSNRCSSKAFAIWLPKHCGTGTVVSTSAATP